MRLDPRKLRPTDLARILNSTALGEVVTERQMRMLLVRAGVQVASDDDQTRVDLIRYVAWIATLKHMSKAAHPQTSQTSSAYEAHKDRAARRQAEQSRLGRDIGAVPPIVDPARRQRCRESFRLFCETYFAEKFPLTWSADHLKVIEKIERAVVRGELLAMAMPRGSGKTTLCEVACLWAVLYGLHRFVLLVSADEGLATDSLKTIKADIEGNDLLLEDFPEACFPVRRLERIHQRAAGQICNGEPTLIEWKDKEIRLAVIPGSACSGAGITVAGITGAIRGLKIRMPDGKVVRPSLVLIDDPQTNESSRSPSQTAARLQVVRKDILGLAGPGQKIASLMTLTVIHPDDLADRVLDRKRHPEWQGERTKLVYSWPHNEKLWEEYRRIREELRQAGEPLETANQFYVKHRADMDRGAVIAWPERFAPDEVSAVQHAMNLRYDKGDDAFFAEYQNEPLRQQSELDGELTLPAVLSKINGLDHGQIPIEATRLTMFVDVQERLLYYAIVAWSDDFSGWVIDYGTDPEQSTEYFTARDVRRTLQVLAPKAGWEGALYAGIERLVAAKVGREWTRDDGGTMRIDRCLIDANWSQSTDVVYQFAKASPLAGVVTPSHGRGIGASSRSMAEYQRKPGERAGLMWRMPVVTKRSVRHVTYDTNFWKSFVRTRLKTAIGDPSGLSIYRARSHRLFAEHLISEQPIMTFARERRVEEWRMRSPGLENHWWDCLVGCAVGASMQGCQLPGMTHTNATRKRVKLSVMMERS